MTCKKESEMSTTDHQIHHRDDDCLGTQLGVGPSQRTAPSTHAADTEEPSPPSPSLPALQINAIDEDDDVEQSTSVDEPLDGNDNDGANSASPSDWTKQKRRSSPTLAGADLGAVQVNEQAPQLNRLFFRGRDRASLIARNRRSRQERRRGGRADADGGSRESQDNPLRRDIADAMDVGIITGRSTTIEGEDSPRASDTGPASPINAIIGPIGQDSSITIVPEAILVEDGDQDVVIATPTLPWWKERRSRLLITLLVILVAAGSTWRGVMFAKTSQTVVASSNDPSLRSVPSSLPTAESSALPTGDVSSDAPSLSSAPSSLPTAESSAVPSSSAIPSTSPSACVSKIISNSQKIELLLDDSQTPWLAVDGRNMVIAVQDGRGADHLFVVFFTLGYNGNWQRVNTIREDDWVDYGEEYLEVAISGKTAFVGFHLLDIVVVYEQNKFGDWQRVEDPFVMDATHQRFGYHVALDGGLASVTEWEKTYLFYKDGNRWVQFDAIEGGYLCSISGDTIAMAIVDSDQFFLQLYKYNSDMKRVFPSQEIIPTGWVLSLDLNRDNLVYWDGGYMMNYLNDTVIYRREDPNQAFIFLQQLNIPGAESYYQLALDSDILVLTGDDSIHIFSEKSGHWEETIALGQRYRWAALSERTVVAFDGEVDSFNIGDCTQEMPTQKPSLSIAPTMWTSSSPSMIPSSSLVPSLSSMPVEICHWIEVAIAYDDYPSDASWELKRVIYESDDELVKSHQGSDGDTSHIESICLQKGEYTFIIYSCVGDGICCEYGNGHYSVTLNGSLIAKGGDFEFLEVTSFFIPFSPHSGMSPSLSSTPSKSISPSLVPSSTLSPTEKCFWIKFAVFYDDHPEEVFWRLWRIVRGGDEPLKSHRGSAGETSHVEPICVPEGEYKLTIYSYRGNGICCEHGEGHYNLMSNGASIVKGGEFQTSETTVFSIPFIENTSTSTRINSSLYQ